MTACDPDPIEGVIEIPDTLALNFYDPDVELPPPPAGNLRRIRLSWQVSRYNFETTDGIRVRITASDAYLMPSKVFAYTMLPMKPNAEERIGVFDHICSPTDLEEYPEDDPIPNQRPAWFRLNYVDVLLRSRSEVKEFIESVVSDVQRLKETLDRADNLGFGSALWIGAAPTRPGKVTNVVGTPSYRQVSLTWTAPSAPVGAPITTYRVAYALEGTTNWVEFAHPASTATTLIVTELENHLSYMFKVAAENAAGLGPASDAAGPYIPTP